MLSSGDSLSRSPWVRTTTASTSSPGWARRSSSATSSVWRRASGEPRVARRNVPMTATIPWGRGGRLQVEEGAERFDQPFALGRARRLLQEHRRLVEELGQGGPGGRV